MGDFPRRWLPRFVPLGWGLFLQKGEICSWAAFPGLLFFDSRTGYRTTESRYVHGLDFFCMSASLLAVWHAFVRNTVNQWPLQRLAQTVDATNTSRVFLKVIYLRDENREHRRVPPGSVSRASFQTIQPCAVIHARSGTV